MGGYFSLPAAGVMFFFSAFVLMLIEHAVAADIGIRQFGYVTAMVVTIGLWLAVAPAVSAIAQSAKPKK